MRIEELAAGQIARVSHIRDTGPDADTALRLREMGFDEGVEIELLHRGPISGDPIALRIGNTVLALRKAMARVIEVIPAGAEAETEARAGQTPEAAE